MTIDPSTAPVVWCDFGGVLTAPAHETAAAFCARIGTTLPVLVGAMTKVAGHYGTDDFMEPLDTPLVSMEAWSVEVERVLLDDFQTSVDLSDFAAHWFAGRPANHELIDHLTELKSRGIRLGMLSNMVPAFEPYWRKMLDPELFDDLVLSYQVGVRKPDRGIYDLAAATASVEPAACILVDDLEKNCRGAREAGWSAVLFEDNATAIGRLRVFTTHVTM
ncbi:HAD family phosphatase [Streptomyces sp. NPDC047315]|uniref:HAD family hydrolase n=1 Tax=Streptomyces sp. NPDC047315 TaxID=3155142 RepID=UPI00340C55F5